MGGRLRARGVVGRGVGPINRAGYRDAGFALVAEQRKTSRNFTGLYEVLKRSGRGAYQEARPAKKRVLLDRCTKSLAFVRATCHCVRERQIQ